MKSITIVSGKGGVGKSSIAASLALVLSEKRKILAVDCDVDASNFALLLGVRKFRKEKKISTNYRAFLNRKKCRASKNCLDVCAFSAIEWNSQKKIPEINKFLCEGCGACVLACPHNALKLKKVRNATIYSGKTEYFFPIVSGQLVMGESGSGKVVDEVKMEAEKNRADIMVTDAAAGIGCPVIASVRGSSYVIVVTEPTPAALSDMKRVIEVVRYFRMPFGIVINKFDINRGFSSRIDDFAEKNSIPVLGKIPYSKKFVEAMVSMKPAAVYDKKLKKYFLEIIKNIERHAPGILSA